MSDITGHADGGPNKTPQPPDGKEPGSGKAKKPSRAEVVADRFKTKLCTKWLESGRCPYDSRCMFAHGEDELRTTAMNVRDGLTTEESIWRFKKSGVLGGAQSRSLSQPVEHRQTHVPTRPTPPTMHIAAGAPGPQHGAHQPVFHVPQVAVPSFVPLGPHYMPYLAPHAHAHLTNTAVAHPHHMGTVFSLLPPMHSVAYTSAPPSPMMYLVDPSASAFASVFGGGAHGVEGPGGSAPRP